MVFHRFSWSLKSSFFSCDESLVRATVTGLWLSSPSASDVEVGFAGASNGMSRYALVCKVRSYCS